MTKTSAEWTGSAEVVLRCTDIAATLAFFTGPVGMRVDGVFPADAPRVVGVSGHGVRLRLEEGAAAAPITLRIVRDSAVAESVLVGPGGTHVEFVTSRPVARPPILPAFVLSRLSEAQWGTGRAGMRYRDLCPGRQGGAFIASHIHIPDGGPVPDYVHFHRVQFQMIFCHRGSVRVVYEDQGAPFWMQAGDCVLQPPQIRHRVLESSADLDVIEIGCPAEHETLADHDMSLPTATVARDRDFSGQRFLRHIADEATWGAWGAWGEMAARDTGMAGATGGLASAIVVRNSAATATPWREHAGDFHFAFVRTGGCALQLEDTAHALVAGDAFVVPRGVRHRLRGCTSDLEFLEVHVPSDESGTVQ